MNASNIERRKTKLLSIERLEPRLLLAAGAELYSGVDLQDGGLGDYIMGPVQAGTKPEVTETPNHDNVANGDGGRQHEQSQPPEVGATLRPDDHGSTDNGSNQADSTGSTATDANGVPKDGVEGTGVAVTVDSKEIAADIDDTKDRTELNPNSSSTPLFKILESRLASSGLIGNRFINPVATLESGDESAFRFRPTSVADKAASNLDSFHYFSSPNPYRNGESTEQNYVIAEGIAYDSFISMTVMRSAERSQSHVNIDAFASHAHDSTHPDPANVEADTDQFLDVVAADIASILPPVPMPEDLVLGAKVVMIDQQSITQSRSRSSTSRHDVRGLGVTDGDEVCDPDEAILELSSTQLGTLAFMSAMIGLRATNTRESRKKE